MKVAIVGSEEKYWTKGQKEKARNIIALIFIRNTLPKDMSLKELNWIENWRAEQFNYSNLVLVSGHCHKGGVDIWAEEVAKELGCYDPKYIFPAEVRQWANKIERKYESYLVDVHGYNLFKHKEISKKTLKGYRSRNIQIAEACDVLYDIEPSVGWDKVTRSLWSDESQLWGRWSGGTWTMQYAQKLGKETHLIVIK